MCILNTIKYNECFWGSKTVKLIWILFLAFFLIISFEFIIFYNLNYSVFFFFFVLIFKFFFFWAYKSICVSVILIWKSFLNWEKKITDFCNLLSFTREFLLQLRKTFFKVLIQIYLDWHRSAAFAELLLL